MGRAHPTNVVPRRSDAAGAVIFERTETMSGIPRATKPDRPAIEAAQRRRLGELLARCRASNAFQATRLAAVAFDPLSDPLDRLPFTTRADIERDQAQNSPYGTNLTFPIERYTRYHQTSGSRGAPVRWLDTHESWEWFKGCWDMIYDAAQITRADRILYPFSFGPFIGFWGAFEAGAARGNLCLAAGGMNTSARLRYLIDNGATVVCCTPTYALHMAEAAERERIDLAASAVRALIVAGEPGGSIPATRAKIESAWGARLFDHAGMTEIGAWGFETVESSGGLFVNENEFIAEVVDSTTGRLAADGALGELVLTNLGRVGSPLIRYRTGDLVRLTRVHQREDCSFAFCEGGVLGRADDLIFIRGNNVFPTAIESILRTVAEVAEYRVIVEQRGALNELRIEIERHPECDAGRAVRLVETALGTRFNFRISVSVVEPGGLPRFEMKARRIERRICE